MTNVQDTAGLPKPASQSRTLRFNRMAMWVSGAAAALPTVIAFAAELLGDPDIGNVVSGAIPGKYRALILAVVLYLARKNQQLRMQTTQPIAPVQP